MMRAKDRQKIILTALLSVLALLLIYRFRSDGKPETAPLTYKQGAVATSPIRRGPAGSDDPLSAYLARRSEKFPGVKRDIFRMQDEAPVPKRPAVTPSHKTKPAEPPVHVQTPEEMAAAAARAAAEAVKADLSRFRFLGYLTEKDNTLFLAKDGQLFILKSGDKVLSNYQVMEANKNYVVLRDTVTGMEARVPLSGSNQMTQGAPQPQAAPASPPQQPQQQLQQPPPQTAPVQQPQRSSVRRRYLRKK